ncbi:MAG: hypothetical protein KBB55_01150 [Candidatus Buchananbacteria bacterium]|nr:hypothetical protein [Candidatus Buchananbacteria bacterium]
MKGIYIIVGVLVLVITGIGLYANSLELREREWYDSLTETEKAHIYEILPKLRHLNQGDIIEVKDFVLVVSFVKASQRAEPLVSVYSNFHGSHDVSFTKRAISEVRRIVHQGEPDYPALAAKFLQQQ